MTAVISSQTGYTGFLLPSIWPKSFRQRVAEAGIPIVPRNVWLGHMDRVVWPQGATVFDRLSRFAAGLLTGFWLSQLVSGGKHEAGVRTYFRMMALPWVLLVLSVCVLFVSFFVAVIPITGVIGISILCVAWGLLFGQSWDWAGSPAHIKQSNWFFKAAEDFHDIGAEGPKWVDVPDALKDRIRRAEKRGWSWRLAWQGTDPLLLIFPRFQPWRAVCGGGYNTGGNRQIEI